MFWTYLRSSAEIERASLDGGNRVVIVIGVLEPSGLTVDFDKQLWVNIKIYFLDWYPAPHGTMTKVEVQVIS